MKTRRIRWAVASLVCAIAIAWTCTDIVLMASWRRSGWAGLAFIPQDPNRGRRQGRQAFYFFKPDEVSAVFPGGAAASAGIASGDAVITIDGVSTSESGRLAGLNRSAMRGTTHVYQVRRNGRELLIPITLANPFRAFLFVPLIVILPVSVAFIGIGTFVFWRRASDARAVLLLLTSCLNGLAGLIMPLLVHTYLTPLGNIPRLFSPALVPIMIALAISAPVTLHFCLLFPEQSGILRRHPSLAKWVYFPLEANVLGLAAGLIVPRTPLALTAFLLLVLAATVVVLWGWWKRRSVRRFASAHSLALASAVVFFALDVSLVRVLRLAGVAGWAPAVIATGGFVVLVTTLALNVLATPFLCSVALLNAYRTAEIEQRAQLKWPLWAFVTASAVGVVIEIMNFGLHRSAGLHALQNLPLEWANALAVPVGGLIPLSFAVAILKYRLMDIEVIIRRTGLYAILSGSMIACYFLLAGVLGGLVVRSTGIRDEWMAVACTLLAAAVCLPVRQRLQRLLDKRFYRRKHDYELALKRLEPEVIAASETTGQVFDKAATFLQTALQNRAVLAFAEIGAQALPVAKCGLPDEILSTAPIQLPPVAEPILDLKSGQTPEQFDVFAKAGCRLAFRVTGERETLAWIGLGGKLSGQPYDEDDRAFLLAAADELGAGLRRVRLCEKERDLERVRREVLAHVNAAEVNLVRECPECGACFDQSADRCAADGCQLSLTLPIERILDGKYRLQRRIGAGGMGAVYEASDLRLKRTVALKVILGRYFGNQAVLRRFGREARSAAALRHPNIVTVYDFGWIGSDGAYLVMERLHGLSWRAELKRRRTVDPVVAAEWFDQLLSGIRAAHAAGIVHRDLKPENVVISRTDGNDRITILDFGLAKARPAGPESLKPWQHATGLTNPGAVLGTIGYMSPEQRKGQDADERSDIYSVGVMLVETLTGRSPRDEHWVEVLAELDVFPSAARLANIARKCLAEDPNERFPDAASLRSELIPALRAGAHTQLSPFDIEDLETRSLRHSAQSGQT